MRRVRKAWVWFASALALGVLALLMTAGWVGASSDPSPGAGPVIDRDTVRNPDGTVGPVVALGDSLTADLGWAVAPGGVVYPSWFTAALGDEPRLVAAANAGIPGDTTQGMVARFARDVAVHAPRVVVILGGTNDLPLGRAPEQVVGTLEQLADQARDAGAVPVLATVPPRTDGSFTSDVADLNAGIRRSAAVSGTPVIDFFSVLADEGGGWREGFTLDGVHPTQAGADAMGRIAVETLVGD
ncbi:Lysophospholipase L1 [Blastococcus aggregatus]|uniref:Lysophospholipase L1 n=1 Tax=Blastococcus aggregatus TaxID=38502 RepID=A0A285UX24_9ACTN|nr:GDSL-type esterase/lipase family protein [Blastococcus aggregatus]SOC46392.1 Lysophospholipase L1 [Blastococcus aggregatus]